MSKPRNPTRKEQATINKIQRAFSDFPQSLKVFITPGSIRLVDQKTFQIFQIFLTIYSASGADGGDTNIREENGIEFLDFPT